LPAVATGRIVADIVHRVAAGAGLGPAVREATSPHADQWWNGPGCSSGVDDSFAVRHRLGIGAAIMGRGKFGPWTDVGTDDEWRGHAAGMTAFVFAGGGLLSTGL
jgi:hypothetical protein